MIGKITVLVVTKYFFLSIGYPKLIGCYFNSLSSNQTNIGSYTLKFHVHEFLYITLQLSILTKRV